MKTTAKLTGQERVNRCFARMDHDRFPRHESFWPETIVRWQDEGLLGDETAVLNLLEGDFHGLCWIWPRAFPLQNEIVEQDEKTRVVRDGNGKLVRYCAAKAERLNILGLTATPAKSGRRFTSPASSTAACRWIPRPFGEATFRDASSGAGAI
jgi:hypothetical protein